MAAYQLRTFADIVAAVREELKIPSTDTTTINRIKRDINMVYLNEVASFEKWDWLRGHLDASVEPKITGTCSVTQGSRTVTLGSAIGKSVTGYWFSLDSQNERYRVFNHTAGSTTITLEVEFSGSTNSSASYTVWNDKVFLPSQVRELIEVTTDLSTVPLEGCGLQKFRKYSNPQPKAAGFPRFYHLGDFIDVTPYPSISGLPAAASRSSSGLLKTLTFASAVSSYITAGDRIRVTGAGEAAYNGEFIVAGVSGSSIFYTGTSNIEEYTTADSGFTVTKAGIEEAYERYRELLVYPAVDSVRHIVHIDFIKDITPLEDDDDEPLIPLNDRIVLVYGALARAWPRERNPEEGNRNQALFDRKLAKMAGKLDDSTDTPILRPSRIYLATKRSHRSGINNNYPLNGFNSGGGSGATTITGTANTVTIFNSNGELAASPTISTTELGWLNNADLVETVSLNNNQSSAATFKTAATGFSAYLLDYAISRGTGNRQAGVLTVVTDGTSITSNDEAVTLGTVGVTLSAIISSGSVNFQYTSTNTGTAPSITYALRRL